MTNNSKNILRAVSFIVALSLILTFAIGTQTVNEKKEVKIHKGKLVQKFKSGGYTYLEYESEGKKHWAASKMVVANVGNIIEFRDPLVMKDFYSKTLKKKFELIYFAGLVRASGESGQFPMRSMQNMQGHKKMNTDKKVIVVKPGSVKKADDGITIAECFKNSKNIEGEDITIRAIVVKVSMKIKGRNWVHIRDGSGENGRNDITFTTKETLSPGDLVVVKGKLILNKDIGSGYLFPVFMEDPEITKENK